MKTYVVGDIHGARRALVQCIQRSGFDYSCNRMIVLGDVCDGYPETGQCIEELLKIKHCDLIIGNHDIWALDWALNGNSPEIWTKQGGLGTMVSYGGGPMPAAHINFLRAARPWIRLDNRIFVHGGFDPDLPVSSQDSQELAWDRQLFKKALAMRRLTPDFRFGGYADIFIGHTPTENYGTSDPIHACNVWNIDTGAGWSGKLTMMDVETKKYWQSDPTPELYPGLRPRH